MNKWAHIIYWAIYLPISFLKAIFTSSSNRAKVHYKMTVNVNTPEGLCSGSSVWSWAMEKTTIAGSTSYGGKFRGEAVAVDLPSGKTLFALCNQALIPERHFRDLIMHRERKDRVADIRDIASNVGAVRQLPCKQKGKDKSQGSYGGKLVSFSDINDPLSIFLVDYHDASATLGEGYNVESVMVTITDEEVTTGIERRLNWLPEYYDKYFNGSKRYTIKDIDKGLSARTGAGHFSANVGLHQNKE